MSFVYPEFLYALSAIAIPIIIHLFNFRKFKRIYFTNVRFLREVQLETQSRSQLKHLLVLLMRILAVSALVLAFAQPYIPNDDQSAVVGDKAVSIYFDNSFSMDAVNKNGRLFDIAKNQIIELVNSYGPTDQFQLLTNDFEGRHQRLVNREEFLEYVDEVQLSPTVRFISEVQARQTDVLAKADSELRQAFLFTDFQKSITDLEVCEIDSTITTRFMPLLANEPSNMYIDSIWFETPVRQINQLENLNIRVVNNSDEALDVPVKLKINGAAQGLSNFTIEAHSVVDTVISYTNTSPGIQNGEVYITDYPIIFDDKFYFSYEVADRISIKIIDTNVHLDTLTDMGDAFSFFFGDPFFKVNSYNQNAIDYSTLAADNMIVLNGLQTISSGLSQELRKFVDNGGSLVVYPGTDIDMNAYNEFLLTLNTARFMSLDTANAKVAKIELQHQLYRDVFEDVPDNMDLPRTLSHYKLSQSVRSNEESLLRLQNGDAFLSRFEVGKGKVYLWTVPLDPDFSNLTRHAIFVTSMLRIAEFSLPESELEYTIGRDNVVELSNFATSVENTFRIVGEQSEYDIILEHRNIGGKTNVFMHDEIRDAGTYHLQYNNMPVRGIALNYERTESELAAYAIDEVLDLIGKLGLGNFSVIEATSAGDAINLKDLKETKLWKYFIMLVLLFLALEILLIRLWKK
jgi:hypothetical protein